MRVRVVAYREGEGAMRPWPLHFCKERIINIYLLNENNRKINISLINIFIYYFFFAKRGAIVACPTPSAATGTPCDNCLRRVTLQVCGEVLNKGECVNYGCVLVCFREFGGREGCGCGARKVTHLSNVN